MVRLAAVLGPVLIKIGQSFPAGCGYLSEPFSPRIGPLIATGLGHRAGSVVVSCDSFKIGVEQLLTVITCHLAIVSFDRGARLSGKPLLCGLGRTMGWGGTLAP